MKRAPNGGATLDYDNDGSIGILKSLMVEFKKDPDGLQITHVNKVKVKIHNTENTRVEELAIFQKATVFIKGLLNEGIAEGVANNIFVDEQYIQDYLQFKHAEIQAELDRIKNEIKAGGSKEDFVGIDDDESQRLTNSIDKFKDQYDLDPRVIIMGQEHFDKVKEEYENGIRVPDKDVVVLIRKNGSTYQKYIVYREIMQNSLTDLEREFCRKLPL